MVSPEVAQAVLVAAVGIVLLEGFVLALLTYRLYRNLERDQVSSDAMGSARADPTPAAKIEDVLLLHRGGDLLHHYARHGHQYRDSEVMGGMVVAVQDFIEDSFSRGKAELNEIRFGKLRVVVLGGEWAILALVVRESERSDFQAEMGAALADIESRHEDPLDGSGVTSELRASLEQIMVDLSEGRYGGKVVPVPLIPEAA